MEVVSLVVLSSVLFPQVLGTWYQHDWWPGTHMETNQVKDNVAITIRRKDGKDGQLVVTHHSRYVRLCIVIIYYTAFVIRKTNLFLCS